VARVASARLRAFSVTDHDTVAALAESEVLAVRLGLEFLTGIEVSARLGRGEVHVLGYAFDPDSPALTDFLRARSEDRLRRVAEMCARLADLGVHVPASDVVARAQAASSRALGRPHVARALVEAGHAADIAEAFDRFLGAGRPAYVPHTGPAPEDAIDVITRAGGLASLAHPGLLGHDEVIAGFVRCGLQAIEAFHPDHDAPVTRHYEGMARDLGVAVTGGSDYHGESSSRNRALGAVRVPAAYYEALLATARDAGCARVPAIEARGGGWPTT
jgi:hypothetical protein